MSGRERAALVFGVWAFVYAGVLFMSYMFDWLDLYFPPYVEIAISTSMTVPFINFVIVPMVKRLIARAEGKPRDAFD